MLYVEKHAFLSKVFRIFENWTFINVHKWIVDARFLKTLIYWHIDTFCSIEATWIDRCYYLFFLSKEKSVGFSWFTPYITRGFLGIFHYHLSPFWKCSQNNSHFQNHAATALRQLSALKKHEFWGFLPLPFITICYHLSPFAKLFKICTFSLCSDTK